MLAIILAAGKSTRMMPLTATRPKALLPILEKPIIAYHLDALAALPSVEQVVIVVGYLGSMIQERIGERYGRLPIQYVTQTEPRGTGDALRRCIDFFTERVLVLNGDDLFGPEDIAAVASETSAALTQMVEDPRAYGVFDLDDKGRIIGVHEKPEVIAPRCANLGVYCLQRSIQKFLETLTPSPRGELELTAALAEYVREVPTLAVHMRQYWLPMTYPWHLLDANGFMLDRLAHAEVHGEVSPHTEITGKVHIGVGTRVRAGVVIEGPVYIGEHCEVGPNCYLRAGTVLGSYCKVGHGCEVKNSVFFRSAKAPHLNYVGDSILGEGVNLGCGTVIANFRHDGGNHPVLVNGVRIDSGRRKLGAFLGDGVHTGINTSIYPGRMLWPHVTTAPGSVVKHNLTG